MKRLDKLLIVGVDHGNYNIKTATSCFVAGYKSVGKHSSFSDMLEYDGNHYSLSRQRLKMRMDKANHDFLVLTLFGIAKELEHYRLAGDVYDVALAVGLPPEFIERMDLRDRLREFYRGEWVFTYNKGMEYGVRVDKVFVCPQNFAGAMARTMSDEMSRQSSLLNRPFDILCNEPESLLIDIGGGTVDVVGLQYGRPVPEYHKSLPEGLINLYKLINDDVRARTGSELSETVINSVLRDEPNCVSGFDKELILNHMNEYTDKLLLSLDEHRLPFRGSYNLVMGGGVKIVKKNWKKHGGFGKLDFLSDIRVNAQGYEEMAYDALTR